MPDMNKNVVFQHQQYLRIRKEFEHLLSLPDAYDSLSANPAAIKLLEQNMEKTYRPNLLINPTATHLIGNYFNPIDLKYLSQNPSMLDRLGKYPSNKTWKAPYIHPILQLVECNLSGVEWYGFSANPGVISIIEQKMERVSLPGLARNPEAMHLLMELIELDCIEIEDLSANPNPKAIQIVASRLEEADWENLSANPAAIELIQNNMDKVNWTSLSTNPAAMDIIPENLDKADPHGLLRNPSIFTYDYETIKVTRAAITEGIIAHFYHPSKLEKWLAKNPTMDVLDY